ncbi:MULTISPECIES: PH domain-containing protein [Bacillus]|uniref:PH domain-containing protein n=1 Tax=Bacillus TaxID=1386 RepID=UPI000313A05B|nr:MULTISPECIES: PH domain-containing protein [Bacillus]
MSEAKRLHPITIVLNALDIIKSSIIPFIIFIVFPSKGASSWSFEFIFILVYIVGSVLFGILSWVKFTYRIENDEVRIDQGILIKKKRYIRLERIQSIDITEGILQRLFSLVKVTIDTAGSSSGKAEAVLTAISKDEAKLFQELLKETKSNFTEDEMLENEDEEKKISVDEDKENILFQMSFKELFIMAATSGGVGVVFSGAFALFSQFGDQIEYDHIYSEVEAIISIISWVFIVLLIVVGLLVAYLIATVGILLKYAFFTVKKSGEEIIISRGLLERRRLTIPIERIQAVRIVENVIRQPLGYATVYVETASGSTEDKDDSKVMLFPLIKKRHLKASLASVTTSYMVDTPMTHVPKRSLKRYLFRGWLWTIPLTIAVIYFFGPWGYAALLLVLVETVLSYASYKVASWNTQEEQLTLTYRTISKQTYMVRKRRIQSLTMKQSIWQKSKQLGTISAFSKTGIGPSNGSVKDLEFQDVLLIKKWFQNS